jgi:hypothetical protein
MQEWPSSFRHKNKGIGNNKDNRNFDERINAMPKTTHHDLDVSPFDEPPMRDELDLGRFIYAMSQGPSPPPYMSSTFMTPKRASKEGFYKETSRSYDYDSDVASKPHDEARYYYDLQPNMSKPTSPSSFQRLTSFSLRRNRNKRASSFKKEKGKSKGKKRLSFSKQLVDVVPEQWLNRRHRRKQRDASNSIVSSRQEEDLYDDILEEDDDIEDEEEESRSFWSQEMSLEYFLLGEWIEQDDLLSPINCQGFSLKDDHPNADPENIYEDNCGSDGKTSCFPMLNPAQFRNRSFSAQTLDSSVCFGSSWCRGESCLNTFKIKQKSRAAQSQLSKDFGVLEDSNTASHAQVPTSLQETLPSIQFIQNIVGEFFEGLTSQASVNEDFTERVRNNISTNKKSDPDALSCSTTNLSDSEDSTLANTSVD